MGKGLSPSITSRIKRKRSRVWFKGELADWRWQSQFEWELDIDQTRELVKRLEEVESSIPKSEKVKYNVVRKLLQIPLEGALTAKLVQGQKYEVWDKVLEAIGFTDEEKVKLIEWGDETGRYDSYGDYHLDWNNIKNGSGIVLLGTKSMKVRWDRVFWTAVMYIGIANKETLLPEELELAFRRK